MTPFSDGERTLRFAGWMSTPTGKITGAVRLGMLERGFALVDTPRFFDDGPCLRLKKSMTLRPARGNRSWKHPELYSYGRWLECLLDGALPEESLSLVALEFRYERAGALDHEVDRLHADGSYIRSVCTLHGLGTVYRDRGAEWPVPCGQTLLMTAMLRAKELGLPCTLHRRPGAGPERAVIVCSFEPQQHPEPSTQTGKAARSRAW
jgi:hypothetical protein